MNYENVVIKSIDIINNPQHILFKEIILLFGTKELINNIESVYVCECGAIKPIYIGTKIDVINNHLNSISHDTEIIYINDNCNKIRKILNILKNNK